MAGLSSLGASAWAVRAQRKVRKLGAALREAGLDESERALEGRATFGEMTSALLQIRGAARISLAAGTACAVLALTEALSTGLERGLVVAVACFVLGALGTTVAGHCGRAAKVTRAQFREDWNARMTPRKR